MPKHPTVEVPDIGPMDHAWDALGEWEVDFEIPDLGDAVAHLLLRSWQEADLAFEPWGAAAVALPEQVLLERASRIHLTDAGGGALQWVFVSTAVGWTVDATLWPGSLHLFVHPIDERDHHLYRGVATRSREYYRRKYPTVPR